MKDHEIRELVNQLRDIAVKYHGAGQLREQIARVVRAAMLQAGNSPAHSGLLPEQRGVSPAQDGNSPVIPDTWIPVSEQLPDPKSEQRVCVYTPTPHEDIRYRFVPASLFKAVCSDATHWHYMEPPVGPQGVKGE